MLKLKRCGWTDLDEMEAFYNDVVNHLIKTVNYPGWQRGVYPSRQSAKDMIEKGALYAVRLDGRIAASVILNHDQEPGYAAGSWKANVNRHEVWVIHTFAVHPEYLGQGLGKKMLAVIEEQAVNQDIKAIRVDVAAGNEPAMALYLGSGYEHVGTVDLGRAHLGLPEFHLLEKVF